MAARAARACASVAFLAVAWAQASALARAQGETQGVAAAADSPCQLTAVVDKGEVAVGEPFAVEVKGTGPAGVTWAFPSETANDVVELRAAGGARGSLPPGTFRYNAAAFALSEAQVPAVEAKCRLADGSEHAAHSAPLTLRMVSRLPKDPQEQKLADIRPPVGLAIGRAFWVALCVAVAALGGLAFLLLGRKRRRRQPAQPTVAIPPDAEARAALAHLGQEDWIGRGDYRAYYIALAQIAKRYLERRLTAPVMEMTSTEAVAFLRQGATLGDCAGFVRDLTAAADQVKFADAGGDPEGALRHWQATSDLIDTVEAALRPAADVTQGQAA